MHCDECSGAINYIGICEECGLIDNEIHKESMLDLDPMSFNKNGELKKDHGIFYKSNIPCIAVTTKVSRKNANNSDLFRALKWDGNYKWDIQKFMIFKKEIEYICENLNIKNDLKFTILDMGKRILGNLILSGKRIEDMAGAIVYLTARIEELPILIDDLKDLEYKNTYRYYVFLVKKMGYFNILKNPNLRRFLYRFIVELELSEKVALECLKTLLKLKQISAKINIKSASVIYYVCKKNGINITQNKISEVCKCSVVQMREIIKILNKK